MLRRLAPFLVSLLLLTGYWYSTHPPEFSRGYGNDMGNHELARQLMSEQLKEHGGPGFVSDKVMAPFGANLAFFAGWNIERDWIGGYVWSWDREFPFPWVYHGLSLLFCFLAVGWVARRMKLSPWAAWGLALAVTAFNVPRHMKLWYHDDNTMMHWVYAAFFLDALIWSRLIRERRWSIALEFWRGLLILCSFCTMGYHWGPLILEWELVRVGIAGSLLLSRRRGEPIRVEFAAKKLILPTVLGILLLALELRWFIPLVTQVWKQPEVPQAVGWGAHILQVIRPLWLDPVFHFFRWPMPFPAGLIRDLGTFDAPETVVSIGWTWLIPLALSIAVIRKKKGGPGLKLIAPFLITAVIGVLYFSVYRVPGLEWFTPLVQKTVPFMKYFRTLSRWGLYFTPLAGVMILLSWPELRSTLTRFARKAPRARVIALGGLYAIMAGIEISVLATPVVAFPKLPADTRAMLEKIRALPGDTVLTFPFCVAGANGICTPEQCPTWPRGTITHSIRVFHDKKVYGAYTSRMNFSDCHIYGDRPPFPSWFTAWREERCFSEAEWDGACRYLDQHSELSALLIFPDIWWAAGTPECEARTREHLGDPIQEARMAEDFSRDPAHSRMSRVRWYAPHCLPQKAGSSS